MYSGFCFTFLVHHAVLHTQMGETPAGLLGTAVRPVYSSVSHKFTVHTGAEYNDCSSLQSDLKPDALQGQYRREASLFLL